MSLEKIFKKRLGRQTGCENHQRSQRLSIDQRGIWKEVDMFVSNLLQLGHKERSTVQKGGK